MMYSIIQYFPIEKQIKCACAMYEDIGDTEFENIDMNNHKIRTFVEHVNANDYYHKSIILFLQNVDWRNVDYEDLVEYCSKIFK